MVSPWLSDLRKIPLLPLTVSVAGGVMLALHVDLVPRVGFWLCGLAFLMALAVMLFIQRAWIGVIALSLFFGVFGAYRASVALDRTTRRQLAEIAATDSLVTVCGRIALPSADSPSGSRVLLEDCSLTCGPETLRVLSSRIRLYADSAQLASCAYGDNVWAQGRLSVGRKLYGTTGGLISALVKREAAAVYADSLSLFVSPAGHWHWRKTVDRFRSFARSTFHRYLSEDAAALSSALLLGDRGEFGREFTGHLRVTGLSHIFALSGMNTGLIVLVIWLALSWLPIPHSLKLWLLLGVVLLYMEIGREAPSLVRASLMAAAYLAGLLLHRRAVFLNLILAAAFIELLWKPLDLADPGFLLSYFAVFGLVGGYRAVREGLLKLWKARPRPAVKYAAGLIAGMLAAQFATLPLVAYLFHRMPALGILGNLVAVPGFALMLMLTVILLVFAPVLPLVATLLAPSLNLIAWLLGKSVHVAASLPYASVSVPEFSPGILTILVAAACVTLLGLGYRQWRWIAVGILIAGNVVLWGNAMRESSPPCVVTFLDVENGDATLISAGGCHVLVDAGPRIANWSAAARILPLLAERKIEALDAIILTHPDNDHIGGVAELLQAIPVRHIYSNGDSSSSRTYLDVSLAAAQAGLKFETLRAGQVLRMSPEVALTVMSPDSAIMRDERADNRRSVVLRLQAGNATALLPGDADSTIERQLVLWGTLSDVELLKCAHHGSKSSTSGPFLDAATPKEAVISVGRRNIFHHPSPEVIARLSLYGIPARLTSREGHITYVERGGKWVREESLLQRSIRRWRLAA